MFSYYSVNHLPGPGRVKLQLKLPQGLECWHCIIQWTYVAGNNWGIGGQMADYATEDCLNAPGKLGIIFCQMNH